MSMVPSIPTLASGKNYSIFKDNEKERSKSSPEGDNVTAAAADERGQGRNRYPTRRRDSDRSEMYFHRRCSLHRRDGKITSLRRESSSRIKVSVVKG